MQKANVLGGWGLDAKADEMRRCSMEMLALG
jgi:hypothetical protein